MTFRDRKDAAEQLAAELQKFKGENGIVLAIPRGGVPMGYIVAKAIGMPLDVVLSKKIGHPFNKEYAIGSVSLDNVIVRDRSEANEEYIREETKRLKLALKEKYELYCGKREPHQLRGKTVIIVDDGIATGSTMFVTIEQVKMSKPAKIVVAVPVGPPHAVSKLKGMVDEVICLDTPEDFGAVGQFYQTFDQVSDSEVMEYLQKADND